MSRRKESSTIPPTPYSCCSTDSVSNSFTAGACGSREPLQIRLYCFTCRLCKITLKPEHSPGRERGSRCPRGPGPLPAAPWRGRPAPLAPPGPEARWSPAAWGSSSYSAHAGYWHWPAWEGRVNVIQSKCKNVLLIWRFYCYDWWWFYLFKLFGEQHFKKYSDVKSQSDFLSIK